MENIDLYPIFILKVNTKCCEDCPKKLKKALWNIEGVYSVDVVPEKKLVCIAGEVDPQVLMNAIAKMGKKGEMLFYDKEPKKDKNQAYDDHISRRQNSYEEEDNTVRRTAKEKKKRTYYQDCSRNREDDVHKIEDHITPKIDEEICRDPYCKLHKSRPIFHQHVPSRNTANHPHHTGGSFNGGSYKFKRENYFHNGYCDPTMSQPGYSGDGNMFNRGNYFHKDPYDPRTSQPVYNYSGDDSGCTIIRVGYKEEHACSFISLDY